MVVWLIIIIITISIIITIINNIYIIIMIQGPALAGAVSAAHGPRERRCHSGSMLGIVVVLHDRNLYITTNQYLRYLIENRYTVF